MSKLSHQLKALINAPAARPNTVPAPSNIQSIYRKIQQGAQSQNLSQSSWLALSTATTMTMNSPESLTELYQLASTSQSAKESLATAEFMREVGLKCISFNGIPRTINCLNAFKASLPESISSQLSQTPTRTPNPENIQEICTRGQNLWDSIYRPFEKKLYNKLADSHPDLPVHILNANYGALLSDPKRTTGASVGRLATSVVAIACLRAQTGVGPQVTSHVFGLRKAVEDGTWVADVEDEEGAKWLASDEGNTWIIRSVDSIVESIGEGLGSNFAPVRSAKI
ncbi:uncharacterized protein BO88DRAFT_405532 [Aspergillus vadensis CBS 113365]|uniref:Uncharacterized protein n=1 Tax=Aspergillus vadensis (strain CBS 113365 / IMI 142717 / IBT 24658) TaxID=1448311 RepID=A0A319B785_ASPVC|nr:hypothetical protein BO88DRAFT_405532 [Aspergillus vadensis CBS 113365]PYH68676.1 hypothetical protein BO88DRAFT_405532 [Aspergillus vadensis CBS 113365]